MCQEEELLVLEINEKQKKSKVRSYRHTNTKQGRKNKYIYIYIHYIYIYINLRRTQTGKGLADNLANLRTGTGSKAINSVTQKLIDKGGLKTFQSFSNTTCQKLEIKMFNEH